ncbi:MAG: hypothetical protein COT17_00270 [Elusimicrobia bacterium CG08_land_8_20_14_0_20_51_18]|nr:MAG: hypothetical protein COT17_00270 [Elusimicrobia bacterium CG08_land_8_20_14_0_20_51_18]
MNKTKFIKYFLAGLMLLPVFSPVATYAKSKNLLNQIAEIAQAISQLSVDQAKAEKATENAQPVKKTPKETHKLKGMTIDIEYPFLIGDSFLTSASHLIGTEPELNKIDIGDLVRVTVHNNTGRKISGLQLMAKVPDYSNPAIERIDLPAGSSVTVKLNPTFKDSLLDLVEQRPGSIYLGISSAENKPLFKKTKRIALLSRNDTILQFPPLLGVFVTPNDKRIDELVSYAAEKTGDRTMAGYQRDAASVISEVRAIYDTIGETGIHYRSATLSFFDSKNLNAQRTYYPAESLEMTGANCLDGSLLFVSALENIGLETELVFPPGHVFVGVKTQKDKDEWLFIETTMVGNAAFEQAVQTANEEVAKNVEAGTLFILDFKQVRESGVRPFPIAAGSKDFSLKSKFQTKSERIYDVKLESAYIPPQDLGGARPNLFVTVEQNKNYILNSQGTQRWVARDNPNMLILSSLNLTKRITLGKADEIYFGIWQEGMVSNANIARWKVTWENFVSKNFTMRTQSGGELKVTVKEVR